MRWARTPATMSWRRGQRARVGVLVDRRYIGPDSGAADTATSVTLTPATLGPGAHVVTACARTGTAMQVESEVCTVG